MTFKTDQEAFWAGEFGTEYIQRNQGDALRWGEALGASARDLGAYQGHGSVATPPGIRISRRAFGRDWRYPITSGFAAR